MHLIVDPTDICSGSSGDQEPDLLRKKALFSSSSHLTVYPLKRCGRRDWQQKEVAEYLSLLSSVVSGFLVVSLEEYIFIDFLNCHGATTTAIWISSFGGTKFLLVFYVGLKIEIRKGWTKMDVVKRVSVEWQVIFPGTSFLNPSLNLLFCRYNCMVQSMAFARAKTFFDQAVLQNPWKSVCAPYFLVS